MKKDIIHYTLLSALLLGILAREKFLAVEQDT